MNIVIITEDRLVIVDGEPLVFEFTIDPNIHAVEWNGTEGNVQFKDGTPNEELTDISAYQKYVIAHAAEKVRLQAVEAQKVLDLTYSDNRKAMYDQLNQFEMQYDDAKNSTTTWVDAIDSIKLEFPKP